MDQNLCFLEWYISISCVDQLHVSMETSTKIHLISLCLPPIHAPLTAIRTQSQATRFTTEPTPAGLIRRSASQSPFHERPLYKHYWFSHCAFWHLCLVDCGSSRERLVMNNNAASWGDARRFFPIRLKHRLLVWVEARLNPGTYGETPSRILRLREAKLRLQPAGEIK